LPISSATSLTSTTLAARELRQLLRAQMMSGPLPD
jgi:hypothetical protein